MAASVDAAVGMMDAAYFTSRKDILDWINGTLELKLTKIEQTASGAVACQIIEYIFPGSIPMKKVNWEAKTDFQYVQNYKLLQNAFNKNRIQRHIDVDKLVRAKYQDNLEFCQWLKAFFDQAAPPYREDYDPVAARCMGKGGKSASQMFQKTASQHNSKLLPADRAGSAAPKKPSGLKSTSSGRIAGATKPSKPSGSMVRPRTGSQQKENLTSSSNRGPAGSGSELNAAEVKRLQSEVDASKQENETLQARNGELENILIEMEQERDFYFEKLRDIEVLMQSHKDCNNSNDEGSLIELFDNVLKVFDDAASVKNDSNIELNESKESTANNSSVLDDSMAEQENGIIETAKGTDNDLDKQDDSLLDDLLADEPSPVAN